MRTSGNKVEEARLDIYEPPRFFEAFLRGRAYTEPPDITARICPVAYQMSACAALDAACGTGLDGPIADLRRLLYCGEWIESHALHIYLLHAPDFLGYSSGIEMATHRRDLVERGLALKKAGNAIMEVVGGRAIHPVNVRVGGFYRAPARADLAALTAGLGETCDNPFRSIIVRAVERCTRSRRRCGSSPPTSRRTRPPCRCTRGKASATASPRRPAVPCATGMRSTRTASSPTPASSRRRPRTRRPSGPAPSSRRNSLPTPMTTTRRWTGCPGG
jgi:hypothetical protein